ncbi:MAG: response regulator transcription factor [Dehalococcoidia bacterium]|nr:response regulator transcription factor [Dehalococcoidia bacterium]
MRILLADDHAVLRAGLKALLNAEPDMTIVGEAADGAEALREAARLLPDVVLMDISMTGTDGLAATRLIRQRCPEVRVVALTMHDNEEYLFKVLEAGGSGYVTKRAADTELIGAIRAVQRGDAFLQPTAARRLIDDYLGRVGAGEESESYGRLTPRELEVLRLIADGYTNQEIADQLVISVKTVETHRAHILEKLGLRTRAELVRYAREKGLISPGLA